MIGFFLLAVMAVLSAIGLIFGWMHVIVFAMIMLIAVWVVVFVVILAAVAEAFWQ